MSSNILCMFFVSSKQTSPGYSTALLAQRSLPPLTESTPPIRSNPGTATEHFTSVLFTKYCFLYREDMRYE